MIDFTRFLAGPWCTQTLADLGAAIIKVERPGTGDETRNYVPPEVAGQSPYFLGVNRNKKSIVLDLSTGAGRSIAKDLVRGCDVVVENFSTGTMDRLGLGYDVLSAINPALVYCAITTYGSAGSLADQPGFDSVIQAESGFASLTGDPDRLPMRTGPPIIDVATAMNASIAVLAALSARGTTGKGQYVEVALLDTAVTLLSYFSMNYLASGKDPVRNGNTAPVATPLGMFETGDGGAVYVSCSTQSSWERLVHVVERQDLLADPRFMTNALRNEHQAELMSLLGAEFLTRPRDEWMERSRRAKVPVGAVRSVGEALHAPAAMERQLVTRIRDRDGNDIPNIASPLRFAGTPIADPVAAPLLDEHRIEILEAILGYEPERVAELAAKGAFGKATETK